MVEPLSTGQMMDRIKVGDIAEGTYFNVDEEGVETTIVMKIKRMEDGVKNISNGDGILRMSNYFFEAKWVFIDSQEKEWRK